MSSTEKKLGELGIAVPEILLPPNANLGRWATVACDQFTQDRAYWEKADEIAGYMPSTLRLILPEVYLDGDNADRTGSIHRAMRSYLDGGIFAVPRRGFVYIERDTPFNQRRMGLVAAVDLEQYSWAKNARPMIRPTEGTVAERLPPRMEIRRNAPLETSHIIMLIDDDTDTILPGLGERAKKNAPVYGGELMMDSGSVSGWLVDGEDDWAYLAAGLAKLADRAASGYLPGNDAPPGEKPFLFAVGDGNHSLASAKEIWEEYKSTAPPGENGMPPEHPCRYAIVEIESIYDPAIKFEPIHRIVFGLDFDRALALLSALPGFSSRAVAGREELAGLVAEQVKGNRFGIVSGDAGSGNRYALVETSAEGISTASLQPLLDRAVEASCIDYIHGEAELFRLALAPEKPATGILLPPVQKTGFFKTIAQQGPLPRKSFSMGEACEKRFYIECRKLFG
ncbi:MAG: DUF1015 domain-containing protein [Treponema sp.]|nr:DUF1015 domain-containing protein [Treponema sp.]